MDAETKIRQTYIAEWSENPDAWDYVAFCEGTVDHMKNNLKNYHPIDDTLIRMLADSMTTYIECLKHIREEGLVIYNKNGEMIGRSPCVTVQIATSKLIVKILKELEILPLKPKLR